MNFFIIPGHHCQIILQGESSLVWLDPVLGHFSSPEDYKRFILDQVDYGRQLEQIKHLTLEDK